MTPSSGLGSFFILRRRGVEQHGRPTVRTMIWTNNPYSKVRHRLPSTETMAGLYFLTTFRSSETPGKPCCGLLFLTTIPTTNHPAKADSIWQYPINADNKKSTKYRFFIDIPWILLGASSDTAFFENHRSTIRFRGHRIATCLYRTPMGSCIEKQLPFIYHTT